MSTGKFNAGGNPMMNPRGVLGISSEGDDRRFSGGLKFSIPGFFGGTNIWQVFFWVA